MPCFKLNKIFVFILLYAVACFALDIVLYINIQNTDIFSKERAQPSLYSPFTKPTVKLSMSSHVGQYIQVTLAENLNILADFSRLFPFVTANVVSFFSLSVCVISVKFLSSDDLPVRRFGCFLQVLRWWLDSFDGVIYRAHKNKHILETSNETFGSLVDKGVDIVSFLCLSLALYLQLSKCKLFYYSPWPCNKDSCIEKVFNNDVGTTVPKKCLLWRIACFTLLLGLASLTWVLTIDSVSQILESPCDSNKLKILKNEGYHRFSTFFLMWLWKLLNGESLWYMIIFSIWIDKTWEFLNLIQYVGYIALIVINAISLIIIRDLRMSMIVTD